MEPTPPTPPPGWSLPPTAQLVPLVSLDKTQVLYKEHGVLSDREIYTVLASGLTLLRFVCRCVLSWGSSGRELFSWLPLCRRTRPTWPPRFPLSIRLLLSWGYVQSFYIIRSCTCLILESTITKVCNGFEFLGTTSPQSCPPQSFIDKVGAMSAGECGSCPGGRLCPGGPTSIPCYTGSYCLEGDPGNPFPCPVLTYNDQEGANSSDWCLPCPGGYMCPIANLTTYELYPCPIGMYCPNATNVAYECPVGTYRWDMLWYLFWLF